MAPPDGAKLGAEFARFPKMRKPLFWRPLTQFGSVQGLSFEPILHTFSTRVHGSLLRTPPGPLFHRFGVHWGTRTGPKIHLKSSPPLDMITMWPQKVPVGSHRSLQNPKLVPKGDPKGAKWTPCGPNFGPPPPTQIWP